MLRYLVSGWPGATRAQENEGYTPLHYLFERSAFPEQAAMVAYLVDADPAVCSMKTADGSTPLFNLCRSYDGTFGELHCNGTTMTAGPLSASSSSSFSPATRANPDDLTKMVAKLLAACPESVLQRGGDDELPLHGICLNGSLTIDRLSTIKLLLSAYKEGASVKNNLSCLPVHYAVETNAPVEVLEVLFEAYPEALNSEANVEQNLLKNAVSRRSIDLLQCLIQRSPILARTPCTDGKLPLHAAARYGTRRWVKLLYEAYPDAVRMFTTNKGRLPLHFALKDRWSGSSSLNDRAGIIRFLLKQFPGAVNVLMPSQAAAVLNDNDDGDDGGDDGGAAHDQSSITAYQFAVGRGVDDDFIVRLLLQACPEADPQRARELNYAARRQLMFLAFVARTETAAMRAANDLSSASSTSSAAKKKGQQQAASRTSAGDDGSFVHQLRRLMDIGEDMGLLKHVASFL